ncbi:MAG: glycosyltransferase [Thermoanaerobaculum sp.]
MGVSRVSGEVLQKALASVRRQSFSDFEFLILENGVQDPAVSSILEKAAQEDPRIRLLTSQTPLGLSGASNRLLSEGKGEFVVFVDHDDEIPPQALAEVAAAIRRWPESDWFFSDEDTLSAEGIHGKPCLKLGFSRHLLLCWNYAAHLRVVRREKALALGGHRWGFEGAQDWDLALRFLASGAVFRHIPKVLYHWRKVAGSMALGAAAKPTAQKAAARAVAEVVGSLVPDSKVQVSPLVPGASQFSVVWQAPADLGVTLLTADATPLPSWPRRHEVLKVEGWDDAASVLKALASARFEAVVVLPPRGLNAAALESLLSYLSFPNTAAAGGRCVRRGKVLASGFLLDEEGILRDPEAGFPTADPGYCNLAWLPHPRTVLLPYAFAAWRQDLLEGLTKAHPLPMPWRLTAGLADLNRECVVVPNVTFSAPPPPWPSTPLTLPAQGFFWRRELELFGLA